MNASVIESGRRAIIKQAMRRAGEEVANDASDNYLARWARRHPREIADKLTHVFERAARAWTEGNNSGDSAKMDVGRAEMERLYAQAEAVLALFGVTCDYPGLYPVFQLDGRDDHDLARCLTEATKPELQRKLQHALALRNDDFAYHATDLYVVARPGVREWLANNYAHAANVTTFTGQHGAKWNGAGVLCLDIPFAGHWDG